MFNIRNLFSRNSKGLEENVANNVSKQTTVTPPNGNSFQINTVSVKWDDSWRSLGKHEAGIIPCEEPPHPKKLSAEGYRVLLLAFHVHHKSDRFPVHSIEARLRTMPYKEARGVAFKYGIDLDNYLI
jgi:hypothetical protein